MRLMDIGLERLTSEMLEMARLGRKAVEVSIEAFINNIDVVGRAYELSEQLRELHEHVSEIATEIIARYQPVATDLRYLRSCLEIAYGFFRLGRYAYDISQLRHDFGELPDCDYSVVKKMSGKVIEMIDMSLSSFRDRDIELARRVKEMDDEVDGIYRQNLMRAIRDETTSKACELSLTLILRYLERMADHATYIADAVEYIVTGQRSSKR